MKNIRNFCIIAHIDHGKSTLADRLLEETKTVQSRDLKAQMLDSMELERERGITIKLQPVRMEYEDHVLNLIDTPGHVDFTFEISRSLSACEGALLVVDASQGIEAQTLANLYLALEQDLEIIPVLNKIDLPSADPERVKTEISNTIGIDPSEVIGVSAKEGTGISELLDAIIEKIPSPDNNGIRKQCGITDDSEAKALIFDSVFNQFRGVIAFMRVVSGSICKGDKVKFLSNGKQVDVLECGFFRPTFSPQDEIKAGEVGYIVTGLKDAKEVRTGDTIYKGVSEKPSMLPGFKIPRSMVFAGIFPEDADDFVPLREALEKLSLEDSALYFEPETSSALGNGFRVGFLGLLHLEIIQERIQREFNLDIITTSPSVPHEVIIGKGEMIKVHSPVFMPDPSVIKEVREPWAKVEIFTPSEYTGAVLDLVTKRRGILENMIHPSENRVIISAKMPLSSIITDFHDSIKSATKGFASMGFDIIGFQVENLVKMDILVAGEMVPSLALIVHRSEAEYMGRRVCKTLKDNLPRKQFAIAVQACIGGKIVARETVSAYRKDVTAKLYGGDVTRKNKLLDKQKKGKKRMMQMGQVDVPKDVFLKILRRGDD
jgi:GTP-binding protein LepA